MFKFFWVYCRGQYLACIKAISKEDAVNQAYMKHGSASRYSGNSKDDFEAVPISLR